MAAEKAEKAQSFEKALARLEEIAAEMESGELGLEKMVAAFEEGQKLVKLCSSKLNEVEKKIELLVKKSDGTSLYLTRGLLCWCWFFRRCATDIATFLLTDSTGLTTSAVTSLSLIAVTTGTGIVITGDTIGDADSVIETTALLTLSLDKRA